VEVKKLSWIKEDFEINGARTILVINTWRNNNSIFI
jgi:hypothetical protein